MTQQLYHVIGILKPNSIERNDPKNWSHVARIQVGQPLPDGWEYIYRYVDLYTAHSLMNIEYGHSTRAKIQ